LSAQTRGSCFQGILLAGIPLDQEIDLFLLAQEVAVVAGIVSTVQA
jgi:hypothetical protein